MIKRIIYHGLARPIRKALSITERIIGRINRDFRHINAYYNLFLTKFLQPDRLHKKLETKEKILLKYFETQKHRLADMTYQPLISILVPIYKTDIRSLKEMLASIAAQTYENWQVCLVDDCSQDDRVAAILKRFAQLYGHKVKLDFRQENGHISASSNDCLKLASGDYVALLDHDDRLLPNALGEMVRFINFRNKPDILYSDERTIEDNGSPKGPIYFKPGWSNYLHLSCNYTTHLTLYNRALLDRVGGFRVGYEGSQDHDLMLRMVEATDKPIEHVPYCLYHWRALPTSTAGGGDAKPYARIAGIKAVTEACERRGCPADVEWEDETYHYRVKFRLLEPDAIVSIVIPSRDNYASLKRCLDSVFSTPTTISYEIVLIDNGSTDKQTLEYIEHLKQTRGATFRVVPYNKPFNFAAMNNLGAREAKGRFLLMLNDDTQVLPGEDWLLELVRYAQLPDVGAVGCKLVYGDKTIQHSGLVLAEHLVAIDPFRNAQLDDTLYHNYLNTAHDVTAVTGACLMVKRELYLELAGLEEKFVPNGFGDIDFCLKLRQRGLTNVYTPYAILFHHESVSRGREIETMERFYMLDHWSKELLNDPILNFNLSRLPSFRLDKRFLTIDLKQSTFDYILSPFIKEISKSGIES